ncbi:MAG: glycoside hydrolase family 3 protein [Clostridiales bacterium]|nr:glycoside hydrolase family 3 protein [Clostridiales bacterium]
MKAFRAFILMAVLIFSFASLGQCESFVVDEEEMTATFRERARYIMRNMTLEEKIYQLFFVTPEALTGEKKTSAIDDRQLLKKYPVGGVILFGQNIVSEKQLMELTGFFQQSAKESGCFPPLIAVDEEGGSVIRVANKLGYPAPYSAEKIGQTGDASLAYQAGKDIGEYLKALGIHLDFAPVADVLVHEESEMIGRAYGSDAYLVSDMAASMANGLRASGIIPCYKHFPCHGAVDETHSGMASARRTLEEMRALEWIPFKAGIDAEIEMIMISHLTLRSVEDTVPASLSKTVIQKLLREELGYDGVVITDALRMSAIVKYYDAGDAAVMALQAGADFLLMPNNFENAYNELFKAVNKGKITLERIDESVERILALKIQYGIIQ